MTNEFWIDKKRVEMTALKINLTRLFNENPKGGMVIQADNDSDIETVAKIADIARENWHIACRCVCRKRLS